MGALSCTFRASSKREGAVARIGSMRVRRLPKAPPGGVLAIQRPGIDRMAFVRSVEPRVPAPSLAPDGGRLIEPAGAARPHCHWPLAGRRVPRPRLRHDLRATKTGGDCTPRACAIDDRS
jgi:hypothetical protein